MTPILRAPPDVTSTVSDVGYTESGSVSLLGLLYLFENVSSLCRYSAFFFPCCTNILQIPSLPIQPLASSWCNHQHGWRQDRAGRASQLSKLGASQNLLPSRHDVRRATTVIAIMVGGGELENRQDQEAPAVPAPSPSTNSHSLLKTDNVRTTGRFKPRGQLDNLPQ